MPEVRCDQAGPSALRVCGFGEGVVRRSGIFWRRVRFVRRSARSWRLLARRYELTSRMVPAPAVVNSQNAREDFGFGCRRRISAVELFVRELPRGASRDLS